MISPRSVQPHPDELRAVCGTAVTVALEWLVPAIQAGRLSDAEVLRVVELVISGGRSA